jgi:hypothetical protein
MSEFVQAKQTLESAIANGKGNSAAKVFSFWFEDYLLGLSNIPEDDFQRLLEIISNKSVLAFQSSAQIFGVLNTEFELLSKSQIDDLLACVERAQYFKESPEIVRQAAADMFARNLEAARAELHFVRSKALGNAEFASFGRDVSRRMKLVGNRPRA